MKISVCEKTRTENENKRDQLEGIIKVLLIHLVVIHFDIYVINKRIKMNVRSEFE